LARKVSGEGPQIGISLEQIGFKRANLKKVTDEPIKPVKPQEPVSRDEPDESSADSNSVKARINMFKQAEKGILVMIYVYISNKCWSTTLNTVFW
jgi:hypothetical protein